MANIVLKTFAAGDEGQGTVTPQDDSLIYQNAVSVNGIFGGATVTLTGANTLHVASGFGIICGRFFEINESDISVQLSSSGTLNGRLKIHLDLNNADNPIEIVTETGATLSALSGDSNININGGAFDMELCTFSVNELTISSLVNTFPTIDNTSKQVRRKTAYAVNDFVLCQSASDALVFICTTAGTTAIQEPTAYATVTDGNTVTDGTAVFKAVSVSGQITQISKIGNLSSLNTTDKSSAVAAINEVNTKVSKTEDLIAYVQTSLTASKSYAVGEQFVYNGLLYKATATIAQGGTITIGGNCELADSVTEQINGLTYRTVATSTPNTSYFSQLNELYSAYNALTTDEKINSILYMDNRVARCTFIDGRFSASFVASTGQVQIYNFFIRNNNSQAELVLISASSTSSTVTNTNIANNIEASSFVLKTHK